MKYELKKSYKLLVSDIKASVIIVTDKDKDTHKVRIHPFMKNLRVGDKIGCIVDAFNADGNPKLIIDKTPYFKELYKAGEVKKLHIANRVPWKGNTSYYLLKDDEGFCGRTVIDNKTTLPEGKFMEFRITKTDSTRCVFFAEPNFEIEKHTPSVDKEISDIFLTDIPFGIETIPNLSNGVTIELIESDPSRVCQIIDDIMYKAASSYKAVDVVESKEIMQYFIRVAQFIMEFTPLYKILGPDVGKEIFNRWEDSCEMFSVRMQAMQIVSENNHMEFIDHLLARLEMSGYVCRMSNNIQLLAQILTLRGDIQEKNLPIVIRIVQNIEMKDGMQTHLSSIHISLNNKILQDIENINNMLLLESSQDELKEAINQVVPMMAISWLMHNASTRKEETKEDMVSIMMAMLRFLGVLNSYYVKELSALSFAVYATRELPKALFTWADLKTFNSAILTAKVIHSIIPSDIKTDSMYEQQGHVFTHGQSIFVAPLNRDKYSIDSFQYVPFIAPNNDVLALMIPKRMRLTSSQAKQPLNILGFFDELCDIMKKNGSSKKNRLSYGEGDTVMVRVIGECSGWGKYANIMVESIDPGYERIRGWIQTTNLYYYQISDYSGLFEKGECFPIRLGDWDQRSEMWDCRMIDSLCDYLSQSVTVGHSTDAVMAREGDLCMWISSNGYSIYTPYTEGYNVGDFAKIVIESVNDRGYIRGQVGSPSMLRFTPLDALRALVTSFKEESTQSQTDENVYQLNSQRATFELMMMCAYCAQSITEVNKQCIMFGYAYALATLLEEEHLARMFRFDICYCASLDAFANEENCPDFRLSLTDELFKLRGIKEKNVIMGILSSYGNEDSTSHLNSIISSSTSGELKHDIARLALGANMMAGILDGVRAHVRTEIINRLGIECRTAALSPNTDAEYMGMEDAHTEFKVSFCIPPKGQGSNYTDQRSTIMKTVASFLNSEGGRLYIGVNDMGYVVGLQPDLGYLHANIDQFITRIREELISAFGHNISADIKVEPIMDARVICIDCPASEQLVEYNGMIWQRQGNIKRVLTGNARRIAEEKRKKI